MKLRKLHLLGILLFAGILSGTAAWGAPPAVAEIVRAQCIGALSKSNNPDLELLISQNTPPTGAQLIVFARAHPGFFVREDSDFLFRAERWKKFSEPAVQEAIKILGYLRNYPSANFYFIGSGMHSNYEIISTLTAGSKLAARIHHLRISRELLRDPFNRPKLIDYLKRKGITPEVASRFILVDTYSTGETLRDLGQCAIDGLVSSGLDLLESQKRVGYLAIPESNPSKQEAWRLTGFPHDLKMDEFSYSLPRWSQGSGEWGKYAAFDVTGTPVTKHEIENRPMNLEMRNARKEWLYAYGLLVLRATEARDSADVRAAINNE